MMDTKEGQFDSPPPPLRPSPQPLLWFFQKYIFQRDGEAMAFYEKFP